MSRDRDKPAAGPETGNDEHAATELSEEELKAVAGSGVRYNFARRSAEPPIATRLDPQMVKKD